MFMLSVVAVVLTLFLHWVAESILVDFTATEARMLCDLYIPMQHEHKYVQFCIEARVRVLARAVFKRVVSAVLSSNEIACKLRRSDFAYLEVLVFQ